MYMDGDCLIEIAIVFDSSGRLMRAIAPIPPLSYAMDMDRDCRIEIEVVYDSGRIRGLTPPRSPLRRASHDADNTFSLVK